MPSAALCRLDVAWLISRKEPIRFRPKMYGECPKLSSVPVIRSDNGAAHPGSGPSMTIVGGALLRRRVGTGERAGVADPMKWDRERTMHTVQRITRRSA